MRCLSIDIETYSSADLPSVGVYKYAAASDFQVLLFAYAFDDDDVTIVDLTRDELPEDVLYSLVDPNVEKHAFNAGFERVCLSRHLGMSEGKYLDPAQWRCTMVQAAYYGAIGSLANVARFLKVPVEKDAAGTRLINKFSKPQKKAPVREGEDWERFRLYCVRDVEVERAIAHALPGPIPAREQALYVVDQCINDRGVRVDGVLASAACDMAEAETHASKRRLAEVTGLANPNSVSQLLGWLQGRGCAVENCARATLEAELARPDLDADAREVIQIRLGAAKASVKKYVVARDAAGTDERLRGSFMFYGAATGRWAGRLMQLQNMPRGSLSGEELDGARELVRTGDVSMVRLLYGDVQDVLKSLVRTTLIPKEGHIFVVADYSAIEARVLAWLAGEEWVLDVFRGDGKVYEATASRMFGVPIEQVDKDLRAKGKVATLALGYQGGPAALERMGALEAGIPAEELPKIVRMWRNANPHIKGLWPRVEQAVRDVLQGRGSSRVCQNHVRVRKAPEVHGFALELPSGRELFYRNAKVREEDLHITYEVCSKGAGAQTVETYGGRLVENVTQAVARDLLGEALLSCSASETRWPVVAHVHDEVIAEIPVSHGDLSAMGNLVSFGAYLMCESVRAQADWTQGLPLAADGYVCNNYRKE